MNKNILVRIIITFISCFIIFFLCELFVDWIVGDDFKYDEYIIPSLVFAIIWSLITFIKSRKGSK